MNNLIIYVSFTHKSNRFVASKHRTIAFCLKQDQKRPLNTLEAYHRFNQKYFMTRLQAHDFFELFIRVFFLSAFRQISHHFVADFSRHRQGAL